MNTLSKVCLLGLTAAGIAFFVFKVPLNSILFFALILMCPLMHLFMGHGMHDKHKEER